MQTEKQTQNTSETHNYIETQETTEIHTETKNTLKVKILKSQADPTCVTFYHGNSSCDSVVCLAPMCPYALPVMSRGS